MTIWTTFVPSKIAWELTQIPLQGKGATGDWQKHSELIKTSLKKLKAAGISGIRLSIYPSEITKDGETFNWKPLDTMLDLCRDKQILVDLCIGPFQYPQYPGIFLPEEIRKKVDDTKHYMDETSSVKQYGNTFLQKQMKRYATDKRIHGFHFANEWPDFQRVAGKEHIRIGISKTFMLEAASYLKQSTRKPISMNTNIDASNKQKLRNTFGELLSILGNQGKLGFDIYPTQETWTKAPLQKFMRLVEPYQKSVTWSCHHFPDCEVYFAEVEAQPWGNGQSWYKMITNESDPKKQIWGFKKEDIINTWKTYIANTPCQTVHLWGSDFWLSADAMHIDWPLQTIKQLTSEYTHK